MRNYRNPVFNRDGGIDCEVEHPLRGWMPCTLRPDDPPTAALFAAAEPEAAPAPAPDLGAAKAERIAAIEAARKQAEAEGVTVNGIRYAGDPANRQALAEALDYADAAGIAEFAAWKDSDDRFHAAHPVADVRAALEQVGARRSQLIAREGERVASINDATDVATVEGITW